MDEPENEGEDEAETTFWPIDVAVERSADHLHVYFGMMDDSITIFNYNMVIIQSDYGFYHIFDEVIVCLN